MAYYVIHGTEHVIRNVANVVVIFTSFTRRFLVGNCKKAYDASLCFEKLKLQYCLLQMLSY